MTYLIAALNLLLWAPFILVATGLVVAYVAAIYYVCTGRNFMRHWR